MTTATRIRFDAGPGLDDTLDLLDLEVAAQPFTLVERSRDEDRMAPARGLVAGVALGTTAWTVAAAFVYVLQRLA